MDEFELDEAKSQANLDKHGIDFVAAQELWKDPYLLEIRATSEDVLFVFERELSALDYSRA